MDDCRVPRRDVENLEVAANVIAIRNEIALRRNRDADTAEPGPLDDVLVVRAHEQTDVHRIGEWYAFNLLRGKCVTESRHRHEVDAIAALELDHGVRAGKTVERLGLLRDSARRATELEGHQSVAVQRRGHVRAVAIER